MDDPSNSANPPDPLLTLLQLEASARRVLEPEALPFLMVNETRRLLNYRQAVLFANNPGGKTAKAMKVRAISSVSVVDRNAPMVQWLERALQAVYVPDSSASIRCFEAAMATDEVAKAWAEFSLPYVAWPIYARPRAHC